MSEAVGAMILWAKNQPKIVSIIASTDRGNIAYFTVLTKNNFIKIRETETIFNWKLMITN